VCGFAGTLQTDQHNHRGWQCRIGEWDLGFAEQTNQFVADNLDDLL
jgi:hypothetical protein